MPRGCLAPPGGSRAAGGFYRRAGLERLVRDVHGLQFHPLPEMRQQLFAGRLALGLDPIAEATAPALKAAAE